MTPEQMRTLANSLSGIELALPEYTGSRVLAAADALRAASDQLKAAPHTPFCVTTSTPDNPCRCWKSSSTDEED